VVLPCHCPDVVKTLKLWGKKLAINPLDPGVLNSGQGHKLWL
jgi:hypothetical protein